MRRTEFIVVTLLVLAVTLPFLDKPFHIDDTVVLHVTGKILESFWDPFSGQIDWFGYERDLWKATTNPPFLSYFLAPFAWLSDYSEIVLHLAMLVFYLMLGLSFQSLSRRFLAPSYWPVLFLMTSVAVVVSGNVMRDIPGTALAVAGIALFVCGSDEDRGSLLFLGSLLAGLAVLTKYSAAVVLPVMAIYVLLQGKPRRVLWLSVAAAAVALWCLHNWILYGQVHILYLFLERRSSASTLWQDKLFGAITVLGSSLLLFPALLGRTLRKRRWLPLAACFLFSAVFVCWIQLEFAKELDLEYLLWLVVGSLAVSVPLSGCLIQKGLDRDSIFLTLWFGGVLLFSIFMVPFQAVRHVLPALPPLILLSFRYLGFSKEIPRTLLRKTFSFWLIVQIGLATLVQLADYEYAESYRHFAGSVQATEKVPWYVGHWGWKFYADRAGFRLMHRDGPYPRPGDLILWPRKVHIGSVFQNDTGLRDQLELKSNRVYEGVFPVRTMDADSKAGFYSVGRGRLPYRFFPEGPLEEMRVYCVRESKD